MSKRRDHAEEPNTGMRVAEGGNKVQGDDLEELIPGKSQDKRGAETFDAEGEPLDRNKAARGHDEDPEGGAGELDDERGAETFDIAKDVNADQLVDRDEGNRRGDHEGAERQGEAEPTAKRPPPKNR